MWVVGVRESDKRESFPRQTVVEVLPVGMREMEIVPEVISAAVWPWDSGGKAAGLSANVFHELVPPPVVGVAGAQAVPFHEGTCPFVAPLCVKFESVCVWASGGNVEGFPVSDTHVADMGLAATQAAIA